MNSFNPEYTVRKIREEMREYVTRSGLKSLVLGQSGGIDSALVTVLAAPVCNALNIPLIGRFIHIETNKPDEGDRANAIGKAFCTDYKNLDLTPLYLATKQAVEEAPLGSALDTHTGGGTAAAPPAHDLSHRIRMGNIKARLRMIYLYNLAQQHGGLVLSTDNHTELLLGYWTLHGDVGDYAPLAALWKTEVYELAKWIARNELVFLEQQHALQRCIDATPTDGLGTTNSDLDQLHAATYAEVDELLQRYCAGDRDKKLMEHPVILRHLNSEYKRNNPYNVPRERIAEN